MIEGPIQAKVTSILNKNNNKKKYFGEEKKNLDLPYHSDPKDHPLQSMETSDSIGQIQNENFHKAKGTPIVSLMFSRG